VPHLGIDERVDHNRGAAARAQHRHLELVDRLDPRMAHLLELLVRKLRFERVHEPSRSLAGRVGDDVELDWRMRRHRAERTDAPPVAGRRVVDQYWGMVVSGAEAVAQEFLSALAGQDWKRLEACFAPDARFFAAVPSKNPLRQRTGARDAASQLAAWFGDAAPLELVASRVDRVA